MDTKIENRDNSTLDWKACQQMITVFVEKQLFYLETEAKKPVVDLYR